MISIDTFTLVMLCIVFAIGFLAGYVPARRDTEVGCSVFIGIVTAILCVVIAILVLGFAMAVKYFFFSTGVQ